MVLCDDPVMVCYGFTTLSPTLSHLIPKISFLVPIQFVRSENVRWFLLSYGFFYSSHSSVCSLNKAWQSVHWVAHNSEVWAQWLKTFYTEHGTNQRPKPFNSWMFSPKRYFIIKLNFCCTFSHCSNPMIKIPYTNLEMVYAKRAYIELWMHAGSW